MKQLVLICLVLLLTGGFSSAYADLSVTERWQQWADDTRDLPGKNHTQEKAEELIKATYLQPFDTDEIRDDIAYIRDMMEGCPECMEDVQISEQSEGIISKADLTIPALLYTGIVLQQQIFFRRISTALELHLIDIVASQSPHVFSAGTGAEQALENRIAMFLQRQSSIWESAIKNPRSSLWNSGFLKNLRIAFGGNSKLSNRFLMELNTLVRTRQIGSVIKDVLMSQKISLKTTSSLARTLAINITSKTLAKSVEKTYSQAGALRLARIRSGGRWSIRAGTALALAEIGYEVAKGSRLEASTHAGDLVKLLKQGSWEEALYHPLLELGVTGQSPDPAIYELNPEQVMEGNVTWQRDKPDSFNLGAAIHTIATLLRMHEGMQAELEMGEDCMITQPNQEILCPLSVYSDPDLIQFN